MTKNIFGPYNGYYVAVDIRPAVGSTARFVAQYKICRRMPDDFATEDYLLKSCIKGLMSTVQDAKEIAIRLAQLQIANLPSRDSRSGLGPKPELPGFEAPPFYPATIPCPLLSVKGGKGQ